MKQNTNEYIQMMTMTIE